MKKSIIKIVVAFILYILALVIPFTNEWVNKIIFIISYLIVGFNILKKAINNIFKGKFLDENFLMSIATIGAFAINEFPEGVAVMLFYQVGELFQEYAVDKSKKSITKLMDIRPDYANVERNGEIIKINPDEVKINETIIIKPGEKIPLDGIVIEGNSMLDTKALTGESIPRKVDINDEVLSGSINQDGVLKVKVIKEYGESTVTKILDLVENASSKKSRSENFITKFAKYYTPIVVFVALLLAVVPPLAVNNANFTTWLYRALSFLVVSCPCALVISIPLSFFGGIGGASKAGILIKGSNYLEALADTEIIVFDKTGTLTKGVFEIQKIYAEKVSEEELIRIAAYGECYSNHPISIAIKNAYKKEINKEAISNSKEIAGNGIATIIDNQDVLIGNERLMIENNIDFVKCKEIGTVVYIAVNGEFIGYLVIADKIKEDAAISIEELKANNIKQIAMLTGDKKDVAEDVATKLKIYDVYSDLLPNEKVEKLNELIEQKSKKGKLIFVGDGINDAPVLALADVGVAMGALGSDAAIEAADVVIMTDELSKISKMIKLAKKTMKIVKENIIFAIFIKILVLILCAFGISTMWEAVFADVGVSIIAICNALRCLNFKD